MNAITTLDEPLPPLTQEDEGSDPRLLAMEEAQQGLPGKIFKAYNALVLNGPCTTRELAAISEIGLLTLRPIATRLFQLGMIRRVGVRRKEGIYQAVTSPEKLRYALTLV